MPDTRCPTSDEVAKALGISAECARRVLMGRLLWRERTRRAVEFRPASSRAPDPARLARTS